MNQTEVLSAFDVVGASSLVDAFEMALRNRRVADVLEHIGRSRSACEAIAKRSYIHPNGFVKLVLVEDSSVPFSLRLHVWADALDWEGTIHNHRWDFASLVLTGAIEFRNFVRCADGQRYSALSYAGSQVGRHALLPTEHLHLTERPMTRYEAGSIHSCNTEDFHQARACGIGVTRTLVLRGRPKLEAATVVDAGLSEVERTKGHPVEIDHLQVSALLLEASEGSRDSVRVDQHTTRPPRVRPTL